MIHYTCGSPCCTFSCSCNSCGGTEAVFSCSSRLHVVAAKLLVQAAGVQFVSLFAAGIFKIREPLEMLLPL
jgi:hypothetical protein